MSQTQTGRIGALVMSADARDEISGGAMERWRWRTPTRKGRWHMNKREAWEAAARASVAHKDEHGRIFLDVFTEIERDPPS